MERDRRTGLARASHAAVTDSTPAPGKRTLTEQVQRREGAAPSGAASGTNATVPPTPAPLLAGASSRPLQMLFGFRPAEPASERAAGTHDSHRIADEGLSGSAQALPHLEPIQRSFGRHDVSGVSAHVGGPAATAADRLGALAYASGDAVAFRAAPDLHTAAHEAAHVVQQRAGVHLKGGVGEQGDPYERGADEVADAVVGGRSAEPLLDRMAPAHGGGASPRDAIQRILVKTKLDDQPLSSEEIQQDGRWKLLAEHQQVALLNLARDKPEKLTLDEGFERVSQLPAPRKVPEQEEPKKGELEKPVPKQEEPRKQELEKLVPKQEEPRQEEPRQEEPRQEEPRKEEPERLKVLEPGEDTYEAPVVDMTGKLVEKVTLNHVLFRKLTGGEHGFIYVELDQDTDAKALAKGVTYESVHYRTDFMAGSLIKPYFDKPGKVFGIPDEGVERFKNLFGFEESAYYAQRALFPQVVAGVEGKIKARAYPIGPKDGKKGEQHENVFQLKDGTPVQVDDGWGYINSKLAALMENSRSRDKRGPKGQGGNTNYQMYQWFQDNDPRVVEELAQQGFSAWKAAVDELAEKSKQSEQLQSRSKSEDVPTELLAKAREEVVTSRKGLYSVLTTGRPPLEIGVAMPVPGENLVLPSGKSGERFDPEGKGASVIRSPIDKQNWSPVKAEKVDTGSQSSRLVGEIEGIQYTLTGAQDGALTFFKGMVGVISDEQWPEAWAGLDLVVCSKDRKLYENWTHDSSVDKTERHEEDDTDRAVHQSPSGPSDFTIDGSLVATQWYDKGSFVGVPSKVQKWLGGDYDGDEVAVLREVNNPALFRQIQKEYQVSQINPKLLKAFTWAPDGSRGDRMVDMRSPNVGVWSSIAARVSALPIGWRAWLAQETEQGRLVTDDEATPPGTPVERMLQEIQSGIKVGTDGYKTKVKAPQWELRSSVYRRLLNEKLQFEIVHNKTVMKLLEACPTPTLEDPGWRNAYFANDTEVAPGEFLIQGVSARVMRTLLSRILPASERADTSRYYFRWLAESENGWLKRFGRWERLVLEIERVNTFWPGSAFQWITQVMTTQKPQTAEAFKLAFAKLASRVRTWRDSARQRNPAWLWTMQQLETLFADYYAPPPTT